MSIGYGFLGSLFVVESVLPCPEGRLAGVDDGIVDHALS
ncbi:hypothetical protein O59_001872 [Cellvibrio sp. BR]|nr:hypothetical protein O59_001872 [Cellvibrio sp. BR]